MTEFRTLTNTEELLLAIDDGDLDPPALMSWRNWMTYRKIEGRRPAVRRGDAVSTTQIEEGIMWREVMSAVYGPEWQVELRTQSRDAAQAGGSDGASQAESSRYDGSQVVGSQVDAGADRVPAAEIALERQSAAGTQVYWCGNCFGWSSQCGYPEAAADGPHQSQYRNSSAVRGKGSQDCSYAGQCGRPSGRTGSG